MLCVVVSEAAAAHQPGINSSPAGAVVMSPVSSYRLAISLITSHQPLYKHRCSHADNYAVDALTITIPMLQMVPAACCMLDPSSSSFPLSRVEPVDPHCTTVPTKYNSYWTQVNN